MIWSNTFIILVVWKLISAVSTQNVGCNYYNEVTAADAIALECYNVTLDPTNPENFLNLPMLNSTDISVVSLQAVNGEFDSTLLRNFTQLKILFFIGNNFKAFELESNILERLWMIRTTLPKNTTLANCCSRLDRLVLKSNEGLNLESKGFSGLKRLHHLDMKLQKLKHITKDTFKGLKHLKTLTLAHCSMESVAEGSFDDLKNLRELYIEDNNMTNIAMGVFDSLVNLKSLIIYGNNLPPLSLNLFKNQRKLMQIGLPLNTWKVVDVEQIPNMFPRLNFFSHIGTWESEEDKINTTKRVFMRLSKLLANSERYS